MDSELGLPNYHQSFHHAAVPPPSRIVVETPLDDDGRPLRQGTLWTASGQVLTAILGSGVLSLPWCFGVLGWVAGPLIIIVFSGMTLYASYLLVDCYRSRSPDPLNGKRNYTYMDAVKNNLGDQCVLVCGIVQYSNLVGTCIGYTVTAAISLVGVQRANCFRYRHHSSAHCHASNNPYMVGFGICQLFLSQMSGFHTTWWLSYVAVAMAFFYICVTFGLGIGETIRGGHSHGSIGGLAMGGANYLTKAQKAWYSLEALGNIAFAYSFSTILIEIQDTLRGPPAFPPEKRTMKKATGIGILSATIFYMAVPVSGYLAFGREVPPNILTGFGFYSPYWLLDAANVAVAIHLVGAYQVFLQPVFAAVEGHALKKWLSNEYNLETGLRIPFCPAWAPIFHINWCRLIWRSIVVVAITLTAMLFPFFTAVTGLLGATSFFPLTVYFPVQMYIKSRGVRRWSAKWTLLEALNLSALVVSIASGVGAIQSILKDLRNYKPFQTSF